MTNYQAGGIVVQTDLDIYKANGLDLTRINVGFPMYARWFQLDSASSCSSTNPIGCAMGGFENSEGGDTFRSGTYKFNDALNPGNATEEASWKAASSASNTDNSTALASAYFDTTAAQFWTWVSADDIKQTCLKYKSQVGGMSVWALNQDTNGASGGEHIQAIADCLSS
jgi:chitinase